MPGKNIAAAASTAAAAGVTPTVSHANNVMTQEKATFSAYTGVNVVCKTSSQLQEWYDDHL